MIACQNHCAERRFPVAITIAYESTIRDSFNKLNLGMSKLSH